MESFIVCVHGIRLNPAPAARQPAAVEAFGDVIDLSPHPGHPSRTGVSVQRARLHDRSGYSCHRQSEGRSALGHQSDEWDRAQEEGVSLRGRQAKTPPTLTEGGSPLCGRSAACVQHCSQPCNRQRHIHPDRNSGICKADTAGRSTARAASAGSHTADRRLPPCLSALRALTNECK
jgi:hypothetical protein